MNFKAHCAQGPSAGGGPHRDRPSDPRRLSPVHAAALALLLAGTASAADYPRLKPGLWHSQVNAQHTATPPAITRMCLDSSSQREMIQLGEGMARQMCRTSGPRAEGGRYVTDAECDFGGSRSKSRSVMSVRGDSAYRVEVDATFDPPMMGMKQSRTVVDGRHMGACPPGMKPGDVTLPGGQTMNLRQMMQMRAPAPPARK